MSLKDYKQTQQQWGLSDNPFDFTPPDDFTVRQQPSDSIAPFTAEVLNQIISPPSND